VKVAVTMNHYLILRLSSLGDIAQCLPVADRLKLGDANSRVTWVVRQDFARFVELSPAIDHVAVFARDLGLAGWLGLTWRLSRQDITHVYDAHNNIRSRIFTLAFRMFRLFQGRPGYAFCRRPKNRLRRWLFFRWRAPVLPTPFRGMQSFLKPLAPWMIKTELPPPPPPSGPRADYDYVVLAPSAAWELKRWPKEHFKKLIRLLPEQRFVLVGGPEDQFLSEIQASAPDRVENRCGGNWSETTRLLARARLVISNDTGTLHIADWLGCPALALIGPTAFGYPSRASSVTIKTELGCQPCSKDGRGHCKNPIYKRCLYDITPEQVAGRVRELNP
jgi:ADP-heptose:LPS heptosyltransferase